MKARRFSCGVVLVSLAFALLAAVFVGCASQEKYSGIKMEKELVEEWARAEADAGRRHAVGSTSSAPVSPGRFNPSEPQSKRPDEVWVVERGAQGQARAQEDAAPGSGSLLAVVPGESNPLPFPLKHTDVKASVVGYIATVDVRQQYHNPYATKIEAVYVFPLPHNAAVSDFVMTIGERTIRGIIRKREEAQRIYQEARSQGYVASLLTEERPNIFTQKVANIEPGKQVDVNIKYFNTLTYADGWYEFAFPMVVGPRFNPSGMTDGVGAVERGARGASGQKTEVQYLRPGERSGHDISLAVTLDAGMRIENVECKSHVAEIQTQESKASVVLSSSDSIPNRDFVLRWKVAGGETKSALFTYRDPRTNTGYFTLMLVPPATLGSLPRTPLEMVFTLDVSGSMSGRPMDQAKSAIRYSLTNMTPGDTFQVIKFASNAQKLFPRPMPVTPGNVQHALRAIERTDAGGGTMMMEGIRSSLNFPQDEYRLRFVSFLTDGYIGNEREILREVHNNLGPSRIFSFGVGNSVNRYLLDHLAKMGNGYAAYLALNDNADAVMRRYFERISHPALTDVSVDFGGMNASEVFPARVPDLFVGRPVILSGKFTGAPPAAVQVKGRIGGKPVSFPVEIQTGDSSQLVNSATPAFASARCALPSLWARAKISDLGDRSTWDDNNTLAAQVRDLALGYNLVSPYTAFLAVDSSVKTAGTSGVSIHVPVPVPDGVRYETTVTGGTAPVRGAER